MGEGGGPAVNSAELKDQQRNDEDRDSVQAATAAVSAQLCFEVAALSDVGCLRTNNEDSFGYDLAHQVFVVCDGMGGMAAGEVASRVAVEQLLSGYGEVDSLETTVEKRLHRAIVSANHVVWAAAQSHEQLRGMGTTLVAVCADGHRIVIGNVGDSRAYFLRDGGCIQITQDHSFAAEADPDGISADENVRRNGPGLFITRAIGADSTVEPDLFCAHVQSGDMVLLATDGLSRYADSEAIGQQVNGEKSLADSCRDLIRIATEQGAEDNVTCLLLRAI
jgi:serine/threonine protein phosphatase PrpC